ncbi:MAG: hypothetical protein LBB76_06415, partial [Azoarcus sp.]|nr:hypothetical protein [Azoarcus sp.]
METYRKPLLHLPETSAFLLPKNAMRKHDERCMTYVWVAHRNLFGEVYRYLLPDYFYAMPQDSGVVIGTFISSTDIMPGLTFPGDIDVLVIPYEGDDLVLSLTLAIEIKVIRASFERQGKSPNQFGFKQAKALLEAGFPFVAVGHLIVSDRSPKSAWREVGMTRIVDADSGACEPIQTIRHDMLPVDLLRRAHGRLSSNCPDSRLGHFSAYPNDSGMWFPEGKRASFNPCMNINVLDKVY